MKEKVGVSGAAATIKSARNVLLGRSSKLASSVSCNFGEVALPVIKQRRSSR